MLIEQIRRECLSRKYLRDFSISLNKLYIILRLSSRSQTDSAYSLSPMERPFHDTSEIFNCALSSPANVGGPIESAVHGIPKAIEACTPYTKTPSELWEPMHGVNNQQMGPLFVCLGTINTPVSAYPTCRSVGPYKHCCQILESALRTP